MNENEYFKKLDNMLEKTLGWCRKIYSAETEEKEKLIAVLIKQWETNPNLILHFLQLVIKLDEENKELRQALQQRTDDKNARVFQTFRSFVDKMFGQSKTEEPSKQ